MKHAPLWLVGLLAAKGAFACSSASDEIGSKDSKLNKVSGGPEIPKNSVATSSSVGFRVAADSSGKGIFRSASSGELFEPRGANVDRQILKNTTWWHSNFDAGRYDAVVAQYGIHGKSSLYKC
jgi:hypothetical protein